MSESATAYAIIVAVAVIGLVLHRVSNRRLALRHMAGRPRSDAATFASSHFVGDESRVAAHLFELLNDAYPLDLSRIHPDDRLVADLRLDELDSSALSAFLMSASREFNVELSLATYAQVSTLRDLVTAVTRARFTSNHGRSGGRKHGA